MSQVDCSIVIDAPAKDVWAALVDLRGFERWNPFIREAAGRVVPGGRVHVRPAPLHRLGIALHAVIIAIERERELRWRGHFGAPWIGSGEHVFTLEPLGPTRTRFAQRETFTGLLPRLFGPLLDRETRRGFDAMNLALKTHVERARGAPASAQPAHA